LRAFPRRLGALSFSLFSGILVMTLGFFFVLPRTARAALERFVPQRYHLAGFSNMVTLGDIGKIKQSSAPVMHVRSYQQEGIPPVKWRGAALAEFDGKRWFNPPGQERLVRVDGGVLPVRNAVIGLRRGRNLIYQVHLSQLVADTLFFAGTPETISIDVPFVRYSQGGAFHVAPRFGSRGLSYSVYGFLPDEWAEVRFTSAPLAESIRDELLSLPALDPRIPQLARQMTAGAETEVEKSRAIENHLRHDYGYTLDLLSTPVADPLAYFLFERKKGHCEYFASAMAVMLRTIGIPARVVTGFQSGVYNSMTGWQVVRASDAHSWVEAWLEGRGWTTFDPTPSDPSAGRAGLLSRLSLLSDTAEQFWQDWVMSYDLDRQAALASRMQETSRRMRLPQMQDLMAGLKEAVSVLVRYAAALAVLFGIAALTIFLGPKAAQWWRRRAHAQKLERGETERSDATILYQRLLGELEKRGVQKPPWLTPVEFARVLPDSEISLLVGDATAAYNQLRFGGERNSAPRMMRVLEQIEKL
jgi:transglutaminase-like putative cysteine protease